MACAVAAPVLEPSRDFPAWLQAQGVNAEVARAMDSELGIRDYGVLRACVGDGLVRAELLATARDRLPFGFYAVLRQVVKALQGTETHDDATSAATFTPGKMILRGLVDVLFTLFSSLSQELLLSVQRLGDMDDNGTWAIGSPLTTRVIAPENSAMNDIDDYTVNDDTGEKLMPDMGDAKAVDTFSTIKTEAVEGPRGIEENTGLIMQDVVLLQQMGLHFTNTDRVGSCSPLQQHQNQQSIVEEMQINFKAEEMQETSQGGFYRPDPPNNQHFQARQEPPNSIEDILSDEQNNVEKANPSDNQLYVLRSQNSSSLEVTMNVKLAKKPYECTACKKSFACLSLLRYHLRTHTGEKPYHCNMCNRSFAQSCNLRAHERTHTGHRPYRCDICNATFSRSHHLKYHRRTHKSLQQT